MNQDDINNIWSDVWRSESSESQTSLFKHRLFVEGYPIFKKYIPQEVKKILDIGGGTGRYGVAFARDFPNSTVTVADILPESLVIGRNLAESIKVPNVVFDEQDINTLSYSDSTFDVVFCDVVIQHLPEVEVAMRQMRRVLKKDGILIVSAVNQWNFHTVFKILIRFFGVKYRYGYEKSYSRSELATLVKALELELVALDGFYPAYGVYRLKVHSLFFSILGKVFNRITKSVDAITGRFCSRFFEFEVFVVVKK